MDELIARYPEFASVSSVTVNLAINDAKLEMSKRVWGDLYDRALCALSAHILYMRGATSKSGVNVNDIGKQVTSKAVGGVSVGYGDITSGFDADHNGLALSSYGREYLRLRKMIARHILAVR